VSAKDFVRQDCPLRNNQYDKNLGTRRGRNLLLFHHWLVNTGDP
jgi:hypothetical protein